MKEKTFSKLSCPRQAKAGLIKRRRVWEDFVE
jgi:hypothetical protein